MKLLTKNDTRIIKGAAVILMLMHHMWAFQERIADGGLKGLIPLGDTYFFVFIGHFGKICVPLFFFLGGYGLAKRYAGTKFDTLGRLKKLYISYWKVFIIFIPIAFIFFGNQGVYAVDASFCGRYNVFSLKELVLNFLAIYDTYNYEWWFLRCYVLMILCFPLVRYASGKCRPAAKFLIILIITVLFGKVFPDIWYAFLGEARQGNLIYDSFFCMGEPFYACFVMGVFCAGNDLLDRISAFLDRAGKLRTAAEILLFLAVIILRQVFLSKYFDVIYAPLLCVLIPDLARSFPGLGKIFDAFGKESTNIWFIHSFFCYYFYGIVKIVVVTHWAVPSFVTLAVMSYAAARLVTLFWQKMSSLHIFAALKDRRTGQAAGDTGEH
ncbi:MAG: acyltransferase [Lachnospiraceae bacterium]|nr:acyltransferase [Lachnospiraceae bacterium]